MNIKESLPHALGRKTLDAMIRREYGGWPPITPSSFYQPHRPEKPLPKPQARRISNAAGFFMPASRKIHKKFK